MHSQGDRADEEDEQEHAQHEDGAVGLDRSWKGGERRNSIKS